MSLLLRPYAACIRRYAGRRMQDAAGCMHHATLVTPSCHSCYARMQPAYDGMQDDVCRMQQAACIMQEACMQGAHISSVNPA